MKTKTDHKSNGQSKHFICHICSKEFSPSQIKKHLIDEHSCGINECVLIRVEESVRGHYIRSYYITVPVSSTLQTIEKFLIEFAAINAQPLGQFYYTAREALPWNKDVLKDFDYVLKKSCHAGDALPSREIKYDFGFRIPNDDEPVIVVCALHIMQITRRDKLRPAVKVLACDFDDDYNFVIGFNADGTIDVKKEAISNRDVETQSDSALPPTTEELTRVMEDVTNSYVRNDRNHLIESLAVYLFAATNFYGIVSFNDFHKLIKEYRNIDVDAKLFVEIQRANSYALSKVNINGELFIYCAHLDSLFRNNVLNDILKDVLHVRTKISMHILKEFDFLRHVELCYLEKTTNVDAFYSLFENKVKLLGFNHIRDFIYHFKILSQIFISNQRALLALVTQSQNGDPIWNTDELREVVTITVNAYHDVPLWFNYGWTPSEMRAHHLHSKGPTLQFNNIPIAFIADEANDKRSCDDVNIGSLVDKDTFENKTGRNDPCPCGSGKKYKHCHGKKS